jgi:hypothetical protein
MMQFQSITAPPPKTWQDDCQEDKGGIHQDLRKLAHVELNYANWILIGIKNSHPTCWAVNAQSTIPIKGHVLISNKNFIVGFNGEKFTSWARKLDATLT